MSKIAEMIKELCPKGIEKEKLGDCSNIINGFAFQSKKYVTNGIRVVRISDVQDGYISNEDQKYYPLTEENSIKPFILQEDDLVISLTGNVGRVAFIPKEMLPAALNQRVACLRAKNNATIKYIFYELYNKKFQKKAMENANGAGQKNLSTTWLTNYMIPLPPLSIQQEIVSVLDSFTTLIDKMKKEVEMRKKQMECYCDELYGGDFKGLMNLANIPGCSVIRFSELGTITRGKRFVRDDIRESGQPCIHYGDMYTYYGTKASKAKTYLDTDFPKKMRYAHKGDVVIVGAGENDYDIGVGLVWMGDEPAAVHDACYILEHSQSPMYISYYLRSNIYHQQLKPYVSSGKISSFSADGLGKVYIPIQPKEKQQEIVRILNTFETYISKLEKLIALRQKQYEYYREKLLTFE